MTYEITFTCDLATLLPSMGKVFEEINKTMGEFGFSEKVGATTVFPACVRLINVRPLTEGEKTMAASSVLAALQKKFPAYSLRLKSIEQVPDEK